MAKNENTKRAAAPKLKAVPVSDITDLEHEDLPAAPSESTEVVEVEALDINQVITREVARFNLADKVIAGYKRTYSKLNIKGIDDKAGYEEVRKAWRFVLTKRTDVEKMKKLIKSDYLKIGKAIDDEEKRLVGMLKPLEDELEKKWRDIDKEKERLAREKEEEEQRLLNERIEQLKGAGMAFDGSYYSIGGTISMDVVTVRNMEPARFMELLTAVRARKAELDEEQRLKDQADAEERERLANDQRKLKAQQDELDEERRQFARQQQQLAEQQQSLQRQRRNTLVGRLELLGFTKTPSAICIYHDGYHEPLHADLDQLLEQTDAQLNETLESLTADIAELKADHQRHLQEKEQERQLREARSLQLHQVMTGELGFEYEDQRELYEYEDQLGVRLALGLDEALSMTTSELDRHLDGLRATHKAAISNLQEHALKERERVERERRERMDDRSKVEEYLRQLAELKLPTDLTSDLWKSRLVDFNHGLTALVDQLQREEEGA